MQSKGNAPTAAQKRFREEVRALGCVISHEKYGVEIHHVVGATGKNNKVKIGHWFILPLTTWYHRQNPVLCVDLYKKNFEANFESQVCLFNRLLETYKKEYNKPLPFGDDVLEAIQGLERNGRTIYQ